MEEKHLRRTAYILRMRAEELDKMADQERDRVIKQNMEKEKK